MAISDNKKKLYVNEHFAYEVESLVNAQQFYVTTQALYQTNKIDINRYLAYNNIAIESVLMHSRNLVEFLFYPIDNKDEYARAKYFVTDWSEQMSDQIKKFSERVNDEIVHLGWARLNKTPLTKGWKLIELGTEIINVSMKFLYKVEANGTYYEDGLKRLKTYVLLFYNPATS